MDSIYSYNLELIRWWQQTYPWLRTFFSALSSAGRFEFYLAVFPLIYWLVSKPLGVKLGYLLALADLSTNLIKYGVRAPRPYWLDSGVGLAGETDYGLSSGHAIAGTVFYFSLAAWIKRQSAWLGALAIVVLMAASRVYLGVHFVQDVVLGLVLGVALLVGHFLWQRRAGEWWRQRILGQRLLLAVAVPASLGLIELGVRLLLGPPSRAVAWSPFLDQAERVTLEHLVNSLGILLGLGCGFVLEASRLRFLVSGPWWQRPLRYLVGMAGVLLLWRGLALILPTDPLALALPLRGLRYFAAAIWSAYYAPMLFVRLRLASALPDTGIQVALRAGNLPGTGTGQEG